MTQALRRGIIPAQLVRHRLVMAREVRGITQRELATEIGVGVATVQRAEQGTVTPKRAVVMAWAMATGVDLTWLETGKAPSPEGDGASTLPHLDSNQKPAD
ncbi:helix-turn-helix domain-containing protein, partial [Nocardia sp. NPDC060259]|uniref:helix-turn-helix domain-containing protein n=1 Tax=Nocardia sp. NPDC060259 TaxID=3347088 RepID=UPI00364F912E